MSEIFQSIPAVEGVRKVGREDGEPFNVAGAHFVWKVKAEDSAYQFSVNEMTLEPGEGVPLHSHISAECFYVLTGEADFFRMHHGKKEWVRCLTGELMMLPPNALHGFYNHGTSTCRLLGISTAVHQTFFDVVSEADRAGAFASIPSQAAMGKIASIALENHMYFPPVDINSEEFRQS
jgi:quercetin dioxygenase-like cupin family protein